MEGGPHLVGEELVEVVAIVLEQGEGVFTTLPFF